MRCYGCDDEVVVFGHHDWASDAERVSCRACWSRDEKTIGLIGVERFAVEGDVDGNHRREVLLEDSDFVERVFYQ